MAITRDDALAALRRWHWSARGPGMYQHGDGAWWLVDDVLAVLAASQPAEAEPKAPALCEPYFDAAKSVEHWRAIQRDPTLAEAIERSDIP